MNLFARLKGVTDKEISVPRYVVSEMSRGHPIFRPLEIGRSLRRVASQETAICPNP